MIPVNTPLLNGNEKKYLNECIDTGWISSDGPFVERFEHEFSQTVNRKFGICVCNGTVALEVAVKVLGIQPGDEIILPTFTIISCAAAIVRSGAVPILIDSDPHTWNLDISQIKSKITSKTKAIMVVHIYGLPVDMNPVLKIAKEYNLKIIEDAAQMHGQTYKQLPCGSFGDISTFSFYPNKHITTGEGGMIVTNDPVLAEKCKSYRNLCFQSQRRFVHEELGWNFRITNMQAALGLAQLEKLQDHIQLKHDLGKRYDQLFDSIKHKVHLPLASTEYAENIYWVYGIILKQNSTITATEIQKQLNELGIGTRPFFWPMHEQPVFIKQGLFQSEQYPVAQWFARKGFYIPSGLGLTKKEQEIVAEKVNFVLSKLPD